MIDSTKEREESWSYQEKSLIVSLISSVLVYLGFAITVYWRYQSVGLDPADVLVFWGRAILVLAGVMIVFQILTQIAFNIFNVVATGEEEDASFEDERDKLFDLKSGRIQSIVFSLGFVLAMATLAVGRPPTTMFVVLMSAMIAGDILSSIAKLRLYRRGF